MDVEALRRSPIGEVVRIVGTDPRTGAHYDHFAFVPKALPDDLELDSRTWNLVAQATESLGRLKQACVHLPNPQLLVVPALTLESLSTSALEGTYAALPEVLEARLPQFAPRSSEVREVLGYEEMAQQAFEWIRERPITLGLLADLQGILARSSRLPVQDPGRVREHQVIIGPEGCSVSDARFIPPPPGDMLLAGLEAWQRWVSTSHDLPPVLAAALAHYQFEALHPFSDGNGRIGRLVVVLQLLRDGALSAPALSISPWLLRHRDAYTSHLLSVSLTGDWGPWVEFFCTAIREQSEAHVLAAERLVAFIAGTLDEIHRRRWSGVIVRLAQDLIDWPVVTMSFTAQKYGVSVPAAKHAIDRLVDIGVLHEMTGGRYRRVFGAREVMTIVEQL